MAPIGTRGNRDYKQTKKGEPQMNEPSYYNHDGLSPNQAFQQGLISHKEYIGFLKGNIIKYTVRCDKKGQGVEDMLKAIQYCHLLKDEMND